MRFMKLLKKKKRLVASVLATLLVTVNSICFAEGIGTAEVNSATENIKIVNL